MSEEYVLQVTYQGIDEHGLTVMLNVRGANAQQFHDALNVAQPFIKTLKPLPVKQFGGAGQGQKKAIAYLPDAPKCPKHQRAMNIREWKTPEGDKTLYFWTCGEKDANGWCREKVTPNPTPEQIAKWRELNGIEAPKSTEQHTNDPTLCKLHGVKMTETSQRTGKLFHRTALEDGTQGFCNGILIAAGKPAQQPQP